MFFVDLGKFGPNSGFFRKFWRKICQIGGGLSKTTASYVLNQIEEKEKFEQTKTKK